MLYFRSHPSSKYSKVQEEGNFPLLLLIDYLDSSPSSLSFVVQDEDKVYVLNDLDDKNKPFTEAAATIEDYYKGSSASP